MFPNALALSVRRREANLKIEKLNIYLLAEKFENPKVLILSAHSHTGKVEPQLGTCLSLAIPIRICVSVSVVGFILFIREQAGSTSTSANSSGNES